MAFMKYNIFIIDLAPEQAESPLQALEDVPGDHTMQGRLIIFVQGL